MQSREYEIIFHGLNDKTFKRHTIHSVGKGWRRRTPQTPGRRMVSMAECQCFSTENQARHEEELNVQKLNVQTGEGAQVRELEKTSYKVLFIHM